LRQHLRGDGAQSERDHLLRRIPAAVSQPPGWRGAAALGAGGHVRGPGQVNATLYALFAASARSLLSSPRDLRRFHLAGGSLLCTAGIRALLAWHPA
jgi:hypothetical protein